jgi:hypothetical protein
MFKRHTIAGAILLIVLAAAQIPTLGQGMHLAKITTKKAKEEPRSSRTDSLASVLRQPDYRLHSKAEELLVDEQKAAIPSLIRLLSDTTYQKLVNTFDLIYPGATQFYGHGHIVPYELDWVAVRAGRLLEEITFENFGYAGSPISEAELIALHIKDYANYLDSGSHQIQLSSPIDKTVFRRQLLDLAKLVQAWWAENSATWNRLRAIKNALESADIVRQLNALSYLRFAWTSCDGLSRESFEKELLPAVRSLMSSSDVTIAGQTRMLVEEGFSWRYKDFRKTQK